MTDSVSSQARPLSQFPILPGTLFRADGVIHGPVVHGARISSMRRSVKEALTRACPVCRVPAMAECGPIPDSVEIRVNEGLRRIFETHPESKPADLRAWALQMANRAAEAARGELITDQTADWHRGMEHGMNALLTWLGDHQPPMEWPSRTSKVMHDVIDELDRAVTTHDPMRSGHEGYAVILEELDELWGHVKADYWTSPEARAEAIQVAAMAVRFVLDLIDTEVKVHE